MRPYVLAGQARLCGVRHRPRQDTLDADRGEGSVMRIVDAQIHLWGSGLPSNMAHRQVTAFTTEEAVGLMDQGGVDAAVIHPRAGTPTPPRWRSRLCATIPVASRSSAASR